MDRNIRITHHARDRFMERFSNLVQNGDVEKSMRDILDIADNNRSIFNNTKVMTDIYDRYGHDNRYAFFTYRDVMFLCVEDGLRYVCVTVIQLDDTSKYRRMRVGSSGFRRQRGKQNYV